MNPWLKNQKVCWSQTPQTPTMLINPWLRDATKGQTTNTNPDFRKHAWKNAVKALDKLQARSSYSQGSRTTLTPLLQERPKNMGPRSNSSFYSSYCYICNRQFVGSYIQHLRSKEHEAFAVKEWPCPECKMRFSSAVIFLNHLKLNKNCLQSQNRKMFNQEENRPLQTNCSQVQKQFSCIACKTMHQTSEELQVHLKTREHWSRTLISPIRQEKPKMKPTSNFQSPMESYCTVCKIRFKGSLVEHNKTSAEHKEAEKKGRPQCQVCNLSFRTFRRYQNHLLLPYHKYHLKKQARENGNRKEVTQGESSSNIDTAIEEYSNQIQKNADHPDNLLLNNLISNETAEREERNFQTNSGNGRVNTLMESAAESNNSFQINSSKPGTSVTSENAIGWTGNEVGVSALRSLILIVCTACGLRFDTKEQALKHCRSQEHFIKYNATQIKKEK